MPNPTADSFGAAAGVTFGCGRSVVNIPTPVPEGTPLWLQGKGVNEWVEIPNTSGADGTGALLDAWCGFCVTHLGEVLITLVGGHQDGGDTRVSSINITADAPTWLSPRRKETLPSSMFNFSMQTSSPYSPSSPGPIYPYCKDGVTPSPRHTRYSMQYCRQNNRIMMMGTPALYGANGTTGHSNGFNLDTNEWDPPGTWPTLGVASWYGTTTDDLGNIWCRGQKWVQATNTLIPMAGSFNYSITAFDTLRRKLFMLSKGDGQGSSMNLGMWAKTLNEDGTTPVTITFNPSAAYTEFSSQVLDYSAMEYDPVRDRFLYYYGKGISLGVVYVITPNNTASWDVSKIVQGPNSLLPTQPPTSGSGTNARFKYVKVGALDGVLLLPRAASNFYFMQLG